MKKLVAVMIIVFAFGLITTGSAQGLGFKAIAPQLGLIMPEDPWDTGFMFGAKVNLGEISPGIGLYPFAGYWSSKYTYNLISTDLTLSNIQIGADVQYFLPSVKGLYLGGGLSLNFLSIEAPTYNPFTGESTTASTSDTKFGIGLLAGYEVPLGSSMGFIQGKYNIISDFNTIELTVGYYFNLGK